MVLRSRITHFVWFRLVGCLSLKGDNIDGEELQRDDLETPIFLVPEVESQHPQLLESGPATTWMDGMETLPSPNDTQAGIDCAMALPETQALDCYATAPALHRTSRAMTKDEELAGEAEQSGDTEMSIPAAQPEPEAGDVAEHGHEADGEEKPVDQDDDVEVHDPETAVSPIQEHGVRNC